MSTQISSRKAKARRLQQWCRDQILESFPKLEEDDVRSTPMGVNGPDVQLSPVARACVEFEIECKAQERLSLWSSWDQCETNAGDRQPLLIVKRNFNAPLAILDAEYLMEILPLLTRSKQ
jgi:hypothetical protein